MLQVGSISIARRIVSTFQQADVFPVVVVTGFRAEELEKHLVPSGVICIRNENYERSQMFDSVSIGLSYIAGKCDRVFLSPVDIPLFTVNTLLALEENPARLLTPTYKGETGHPVLIGSELIPSLLSSKSQDGLRGALNVCGEEMQYLEVPDEGILHDADTPSDYQALLECHNRQLLRPDVQLSLSREQKLFDKQAALLLHLVDFTGTVRTACSQMHISYSKGWSMLRELEANLGFPLLDRKHGGENGGSSALTFKGKDLLERYDRFEATSKSRIQEAFDECFEDF